ncbi:hypothetical protein PS15m_002003 [Mucor circinelloides]
MNHPYYHARFTVYPPPPLPPPVNQHAITTMHALNYIPPHHHSAPPYQHSHYYMPTQWQLSTYASRRSSSLSSHPTHRKRKKSITTSPTHENRLQKVPFSVTKSFKSTVNWMSKTFCFCYSDDTIEFNDHYYKKDEKSS